MFSERNHLQCRTTGLEFLHTAELEPFVWSLLPTGSTLPRQIVGCDKIHLTNTNQMYRKQTIHSPVAQIHV